MTRLGPVIIGRDSSRAFVIAGKGFRTAKPSVEFDIAESRDVGFSQDRCRGQKQQSDKNQMWPSRPPVPRDLFP